MHGQITCGTGTLSDNDSSMMTHILIFITPGPMLSPFKYGQSRTALLTAGER